MDKNFQWDQKPFDAALRKYLGRLKNDKIPKAINKKAFFVTLRTFGKTPKKEPDQIAADVMRPVIATRRDGSTSMIPLLWALAAKRVGKIWPEQKMSLGIRNKTGRSNLLRSYLSALRKKAGSILGSRKRAGGFLRVGWLSVIKQLGPAVRSRAGAPVADLRSAKLKGVMKGEAKPARPGLRPTCTIMNSAQARHDKRNGLIRFGAPALQQGFDEEMADTIAYLEREMNPETTDCNRELK